MKRFECTNMDSKGFDNEPNCDKLDQLLTQFIKVEEPQPKGIDVKLYNLTGVRLRNLAVAVFMMYMIQMLEKFNMLDADHRQELQDTIRELIL